MAAKGVEKEQQLLIVVQKMILVTSQSHKAPEKQWHNVTF